MLSCLPSRELEPRRGEHIYISDLQTKAAHVHAHMYTRYIMCNLINVQLQPFKSTLSMAHVEMPRCVTNTCDDLPPDVLLQLSLVCVVVV